MTSKSITQKVVHSSLDILLPETRYHLRKTQDRVLYVRKILPMLETGSSQQLGYIGIPKLEFKWKLWRWLLFNILGFELIMNPIRLSKVLMLIAIDPLSDWRVLNLGFVHQCLFFNPLTVKYLLKEDTNDVWKYFMASCIAILRERRDLLDPQRDPENEIMIVGMFYSFTRTMRFWNEEQCVFAIDHGFLDAVVGMMECPATVDLPTGVNVWNQAGPFECGFYALHWFSYFVKRLDRIQRKSSGVGKRKGANTLSIMQYFQTKLSEFKRKTKRNGFKDVDLKSLGRDMLVMQPIILPKGCAWPLCQESKGPREYKDYESREGKYKCSRCHMITYCCRNHQKKHWKFIHRQQCDRFVDYRSDLKLKN